MPVRRTTIRHDQIRRYLTGVEILPDEHTSLDLHISDLLNAVRVPAIGPQEYTVEKIVVHYTDGRQITYERMGLPEGLSGRERQIWKRDHFHEIYGAGPGPLTDGIFPDANGGADPKES